MNVMDTRATSAMLYLDGVHVSFDGFHAINNLSLTLAPGEMITHIRVPVGAFGRASTYHKIRDRESYAFALTSAAVALDMDGDTVRQARIALGGVAS